MSLEVVSGASAAAIARIMAYTSEAGLNFGDASAVKEALNGLENVEDVEYALIYDKENALFADLKGDHAHAPLPGPSREVRIRLAYRWSATH